MGSKSPTTSTNQTSTYQANPAVQSATQGLVSSATSLSQNPYQAFTGQMVSPTTAQQQTGYGQITQAAGIYSPYATAALGAISGIPQYNAATIQSYMSPYTGQVVQATEQQLQNTDAQQQAQLTGNAISAGAFGGDRAAVASSVLGGQQDIANNATIAGLYQGAFQNAQGELNSQQQVGLQTGSAYSGLGTTAQTNALNAAGANVQAGTQQQSTQTSIDQANYQLYQNALAYPYQNLSFLSGILGTAGSTLGGTTNASGTSTQTGISNVGSILGGIASIGALFSDKRMKDNIEEVGRLYDGTPVYKFNYKGHPETQIGLMAQDVEKKHPEAVGKTDKGYRYLNYDMATEDAAARKHFDAGGVVIPYGGGGAGGIIPLGNSTLADGGGQQMSDQGLQALSANRSGSAVPQNTSTLGQLAGVLQNKQSLQGIQNGMSFLGSAGFGALSPDSQLSALGGGDEMTGFADTFGLRRGGIVKGFADGGAPYGDLSGVNFDPGPAPSSTYDFPMSATAPSGASVPVQTAPPMASPVPSNIVMPAPPPPPTSGIAAINSALQSAPSNTDTFDRMVTQESGGHQFTPDGQPLTSPKGAIGVAQVMPGTGPEAAAAAGLPWDPDRLQNDKSYNLALGRAYYQKQLDAFGSPTLAAAAYNAGPGAVSAAVAEAAKNGGSYLDYLPAETQNYVARVAGPGNSGGVAGTALAFDGAGPTGSGLPVQSTPTTASSSAPLGGVSQFFSGLFGGGNNSPTPANAQHQMGGFNPLGLSDTARMGMLGAGLGMMASRSPFPGQQIGEGGLAGIQAYMQAANQQREQAATQSDIAYKQGTLELAQRQAQRLYDTAARIAAINGGPQPAPYGASGGARPSGPVAQPAATSASGQGVPAQGQGNPPIAAPSAGVAMPPAPTAGTASNFDWSKVAPESNPFYLDQQADLNERRAQASLLNPELQRNFVNLANRDRQAAQTIRQSGRATLNDGSTVMLPGALEATGETAAATANAQEAAKAPYDLVPTQPVPGGPTVLVPKSQLIGGAGAIPDGGAKMDAAAASNPMVSKQPGFIEDRQKQLAKDEDQMTKEFQIRQLSEQRLQALSQIMRTYQPGAFAEEKAQLVASLRGAGINVPDSATTSPAAFQEFTKNAIANVFNDVKSMGGGRVLMSEIMGLTKANANPELQPAAAAAIIGQGMGVARYLDQHFKDYMDWKQQNPYAYNTSAFEIPWAEKNKAMTYVDQATKGIAYRGQVIPTEPSQRVAGQAYLTPKGAYVWTGRGWQAQQ